MMNAILSPYLHQFCVVYLDNILIFSKTGMDHLQHIDTILSTLEENNLWVSITKYAFWQNTLDYLGHNVSNGTVEPQESFSC